MTKPKDRDEDAHRDDSLLYTVRFDPKHPAHFLVDAMAKAVRSAFNKGLQPKHTEFKSTAVIHAYDGLPIVEHDPVVECAICVVEIKFGLRKPTQLAIDPDSPADKPRMVRVPVEG